EVVAGQVGLDHDVPAEASREFVAGDHLFLGEEIDGDTLALVVVQRLVHDRHADFLSGGPGVFGIADRAAHGHRHAAGVQELLGQLLVLGAGFGNCRTAVGLGGLDAALFAAPAELHQAAGGKAAIRNAAYDGSI